MIALAADPGFPQPASSNRCNGIALGSGQTARSTCCSRPSRAGRSPAPLRVTASPGGEAIATLTGTLLLPAASVDDLPDPAFLDTNCDGIDGTVDRAVFVATNGIDSNPGTRDAPCATVNAAI